MEKERKIAKGKLDNILEEIFSCNICLQIIFDPVQCSRCQNMFCKNCIAFWKKTNEICPFHCSMPLSFQPINKNLLLLYEKIKFSCTFTPEGCKFEGTCSQILEHEKKCLFSKNLVLRQAMFVDKSKEEEKKSIPIPETISSTPFPEEYSFAPDAKPIMAFFEFNTKNMYIVELENLPKFFRTRKIALQINFVIPQGMKGIITPKGEIFCFGGRSEDKTYRFNPTTLSLDPRAPMNGKKGSVNLKYLDNFIYCFGGLRKDPDNEDACIPLNDCGKYDIVNNFGISLASMNETTFESMIVYSKPNFFYRFGGVILNPDMSTSIERYSECASGN